MSNNLKFVVPKMDETFGTLLFGSEEVTAATTSGFGSRMKVTSRTYHLYSSIQRADDITVTLTGNTGAHPFNQMDKVKLVNPNLQVNGETAGSNSYVDYTMFADDMEKIQ
jgi:hypothetical protein